MDVEEDVHSVKHRKSGNCEENNDSRLHMEESGSLDNQSTKLYLALKPLILTMKVFGMYFLDKTAFSNCLKTKVLFGYSVVNVVTLWVIFCVQLSRIAKTTNLNDIVSYGNDVVWCFSITCQGTAMFFICLKKTGWQQLFLTHKHAQKGIWKSDIYVQFKKRVIMYVLICWTVLLIHGAIVIYFVSINNHNLVSRCFMFISRVYVTAFWIVPLTLSVVINDLLCSEFRSFNSRLRSEVKKFPVQLCKSLHHIRNMYQRLADLVKSVNEMLFVFIMASITATVVNTCCILYMLIYNEEREGDIIITISHIVFLVSGLITLWLIIGGCAWVKTKVILFSMGHILKSVMFYCKWTDSHTEYSIGLCMFL